MNPRFVSLWAGHYAIHTLSSVIRVSYETAGIKGESVAFYRILRVGTVLGGDDGRVRAGRLRTGN
jgi:hypothetical protein